MDNTGLYVTYKELLEQLFPSTYVSYKSKITLSLKAVNTFTFAGSSFTPQIGDIVCQNEFAATITNVTGTQLTVDSATNIVNGSASIFRCTETVEDLERSIKSAMQKIDLLTGQWFNKRTFTGASALRFEGNNSYILHFSVPIIEITSLKTNDDTVAQDPTRYVVFNSRTLPDDRRNPRIKLMTAGRNIFSGIGRVDNFYKYTMQYIEGSFGFLEPDGSTPDGIKYVTSKLVMMDISSNPEESITEGVKVKSETVDIHSIEYMESKSNDSNGGTGAGRLTGNPDIDRILLLYKSPMVVSGTDPLYSSVRPFYEEC